MRSRSCFGSCPRLLAAAALLLFVGADGAAAASLDAVVSVCHFPFGPLGDATCEIPTVEPGRSSADFSLLNPSDPSALVFVSRGIAVAGYGSIGVLGSLRVANATEGIFLNRNVPGSTFPRGYIPVYARAGFQDSLIILGGTGTGTLRLTFDVSGVLAGGCDAVVPCLSTSPNLQAPPILNVSFGGGSPAGGVPGGFAGEPIRNSAQNPNPGAIARRYVTGPIPFTFGAPIPVEASLDLVLSVDYETVISGPADRFDSQGFIDFSNTATLSGIEVRDASGSLVTGFSVSSESGSIYPVPEPSALALLGAGVAAALALRALSRRA